MKTKIYSFFLTIILFFGIQIKVMPYGITKITTLSKKVNDDLSILKRLGIPIVDTDKLVKTTSSRKSVIIWNTNLNKLRIYNDKMWKDATQNNLLDYYTKAEVDDLLASINYVVATKANDVDVIHKTGNETKTGDLTITGNLTTNFLGGDGMDIFVDNTLSFGGVNGITGLTDGVNSSDAATYGQLEGGLITVQQNINDNQDAVFDRFPGGYLDVFTSFAKKNGSNIEQSGFRTALGLGTNAYNSTAYLPLTGGTLSGELTVNRLTNFGISVLKGTIFMALPNTDDINPDGGTNNLMNFNNGDIAFREGTDKSFNIDVYNGGVEKNSLKIHQNGDIGVNGNISANNFIGNATSATQWGSAEADFETQTGSLNSLIGFSTSGKASYWTLAQTKDWLGLGSNSFLPLTGGNLTGLVRVDLPTNGDSFIGTGPTSNFIVTHDSSGDVNLRNTAGSFKFNGNLLGSNAYNSTDYLPLIGGSLSGHLDLVNNELRFNEVGVRSWSIKASGGNLNFNSGSPGNFIFNGAGYFNNSLTAASFNTNGQAHAYLGNAGNNDMYLSGGGTFRIVNGANTRSLLAVYNDGGLRVDAGIVADGNLGIAGTSNFGNTVTVATGGLTVAAGNVGIGTASPVSALSIKGNGTGLSFQPIGNPYFGSLGFNRESANGQIMDGNGNAFQINNGGTDLNLHFQVYNGSGNMITNDALVISGTNGNVGIGISNPDEKLTVNGKIHAKEVRIDLSIPGPDYVFEKQYQLTSLSEIQKYIQENKHLPEVPSAKEMEENGINVSEMNMLLLKKVEELTLHLIEKDGKIQELEKGQEQTTQLLLDLQQKVKQLVQKNQ